MKIHKKRISGVILFLLSILPWAVTTAILFLRDPPVWPDEPFFYTMSQNIGRPEKNIVHLFGGILGGDEYTLWYPHSLYMFIQRGWTSVFGTSIEAVRVLSVLTALLTLIVFYFTVKAVLKRDYLAPLSCFLLSTTRFFSSASRIGRPDMLALLFILLSFLCISVSGIKNIKFKILLTGLFVLLAFVSHPLGILALMFVFLLIFLSDIKISDKIRRTGLVILPLAVFFLLWILQLYSNHSTFLAQYGMRLTSLPVLEPYVVTLFNHYNSWRMLIGLKFFMITFLIVQLFRHHDRLDFCILLGLFINIAINLFGKELWYLLFFQPFLVLAVLKICLYSEEFFKNRAVRLVLAACLVLLFSGFNTYILLEDSAYTQSGNYHEFTHLISRVIPRRPATVYLSVIPDPFFDLKKRPELKFVEFPTVEVPDEAYKKVMDSVDYVVDDMGADQDSASYENVNARRYTRVVQKDGYDALVIELLPLKFRK